VRLTFASYNIHKGVGRDRRRDADRIMAVLHELAADVIALQEADRRFGSREAVLPRQLIEEQHWRIVPVAGRPASMGWHGNAILVRREIEIVDAQPIVLPALEPRGAIRASLRHEGGAFEVVGMHLDLSGLLRRKQISAVCADLAQRGTASVLMGDLNEWSPRKGALLAFQQEWTVLNPGRSFPSRQPLASLDRIVHSPHWGCEHTGVHHSALAAVASDHLPVKATLSLLPA
jgi:endonuclease/exonuclease/phosphatase family metal-dependent hydrolase